MVDITPLLVLCALGVVWQLVGAFGPSAGPYKIVLTQLESCADEGTGEVHFDSKIESTGQGKHVFNSSFSLLKPFDENTKVYFDVQQWGNGGYKPRSIEYTANSCDDLWKFGENILSSLLKSAGVEVNKCPIPKGNYTANNWDVELTLNNIPTFTYNKYKVILVFYYKGVKVGCEIVYAEIVAKSFK